VRICPGSPAQAEGMMTLGGGVVGRERKGSGRGGAVVLADDVVSA
jgi:hypothetical protein